MLVERNDFVGGGSWARGASGHAAQATPLRASGSWWTWTAGHFYCGQGSAASRRHCRKDHLLTALLDECPDKVFSIGLQHVVDLVEDGVDVLSQLLVAFGDVGICLDGLLDIVVLLALRPALAAVVGRHHGPPSRVGLHPNSRE